MFNRKLSLTVLISIIMLEMVEFLLNLSIRIWNIFSKTLKLDINILFIYKILLDNNGLCHVNESQLTENLVGLHNLTILPFIMTISSTNNSYFGFSSTLKLCNISENEYLKEKIPFVCYQNGVLPITYLTWKDI